jgi:hypothetical protein
VLGYGAAAAAVVTAVVEAAVGSSRTGAAVTSPHVVRESTTDGNGLIVPDWK